MESIKNTTKIWEIIAFIVMVMMEGFTIALTIFAKTELNNGMSPFVFIVYTNALATIILFPSSFLLLHNNNNNGGRKEPTPSPFTFSLFIRFLLLGFTGITMTQSFSFLGLSYSSPILVCAMGLLIPTFNFLLSLIFRETELNLRSSGFQVQAIGVMISIMGGLEAELLKGPLIRPTSSSSDDKLQFTKKTLFVFSSVPEFWVLGGILLASASFSVALWNFIQKKTVKEYPEPMKGVAYYSLIGTMLSAIVAWIVERDDANAWKLNNHMQLILIILTALFGGVIRPNIQIWFTRMKGPFYVPLFKPFGIAFATTFGVCIFPNSLHYGSVIGAAIIGMGYYTIIWGQMKGEEEKRFVERSDYLDNKIPLLQEKMEEV